MSTYTSLGLNIDYKKYVERPYFSSYPVISATEEGIQLGCKYLGIKKLTRLKIRKKAGK